MFTHAEERALTLALMYLRKEIAYYEGLVADLREQGNKQISLNMMERKMNRYVDELKTFEEIKERGHF